jgi:hypothetical protein
MDPRGLTSPSSKKCELNRALTGTGRTSVETCQANLGQHLVYDGVEVLLRASCASAETAAHDDAREEISTHKLVSMKLGSSLLLGSATARKTLPEMMRFVVMIA